ncbi:hypothetical protein SMICM304S_02590 [Streptomyces microflavus]
MCFPFYGAGPAAQISTSTWSSDLRTRSGTSQSSDG